MKEPGDLVRVPDKVSGKLGRDDGIDRLPIGLREVDEPPGRRLREKLLLRVPLEGNCHTLGAVPAAPKFVDQSPDVEFRASVDERHLRFADDHPGTGKGHEILLRSYVANRKLMMSPSCTTYSLPSSRTSPWARQAAIDPRPTSPS